MATNRRDSIGVWVRFCGSTRLSRETRSNPKTKQWNPIKPDQSRWRRTDEVQLASDFDSAARPDWAAKPGRTRKQNSETRSNPIKPDQSRWRRTDEVQLAFEFVDLAQQIVVLARLGRHDGRRLDRPSIQHGHRRPVPTISFLFSSSLTIQQLVDRWFVSSFIFFPFCFSFCFRLQRVRVSVSTFGNR